MHSNRVAMVAAAIVVSTTSGCYPGGISPMLRKDTITPEQFDARVAEITTELVLLGRFVDKIDGSKFYLRLGKDQACGRPPKPFPCKGAICPWPLDAQVIAELVAPAWMATNLSISSSVGAGEPCE